MSSTKSRMKTCWGYLRFALNALVFLPMGLKVSLTAVVSALAVIVLAYPAMTAARLAAPSLWCWLSIS